MGIDVTTRLAKVMLHSFKHTAELIVDMNNRAGRAAEVPAGNGVADAASLARMYAAMIGEVDGVRSSSRRRWSRPAPCAPGRCPRPATSASCSSARRSITASATSFRATCCRCWAKARSATPAPAAASASPTRRAASAAAYVANTMLTVMGAPDPRWSWMEELRKAV